MAYRKQNDKNWNNKEIVEKELWTRIAQNNSYAGAPYQADGEDTCMKGRFIIAFHARVIANELR